MIQNNSLLERIENIDYTHLLGYPAEVVAVEVKAMAKEVVSDYMEKVAGLLERELTPAEYVTAHAQSVHHGYGLGIKRAIEIVKGGAV